MAVDSMARAMAASALENGGRGQLRPEFAESIEWLEENGDTSKVYVLPDGYLYAWIYTEGASFTNQIPLSTDENGDTYNITGYKDGYRFNSSQIETTQDGAFITGFIPVKPGDTIRLNGNYIQSTNSIAASIGHVLYASDKSAFIGGRLPMNNAEKLNQAYRDIVVKDGYVVQFTLLEEWTYVSNWSDLAYIRLNLLGSGEGCVVTVNEEISESADGGYVWRNTGHAFVPADYEDRVIELEEDVLSLQNEIKNNSGNTSSETVTIPPYWRNMVAAKTEIIKALQESGGKDCVSFAWASDTHIPDNDGTRTNDIGKVMAKMLDNCEIPFAVISGDIATRASRPTEAKYLEKLAELPVYLAPLWGTDRLLMALGNHDGCYGDSTGYYRKQFSCERMWQTFFRGQALDFRRVFSEDGLYYYVDNVAQKTRFIVLNSHFGGEYAEDENGWAVNNRFGISCFGQTQLEWLADAALDMPEGYSAIITAHVPPNITYTVDKEQFIGIINAYNNKTTYSGSYTAGVEGWTNNNISVDFTQAQGEIIAMFAGHVHGDSIDTATLSCPLITILSAGAPANEPYIETAPTRTNGTDTETSFDIVTIDKKARKIYCTRIGAGNDREISY